MRILLITHYFAPENAAPQRRWDGIGAELVKAGHELHVLCPPPHYPSGRVREGYRKRYRPGSWQITCYGATVHRVAYLPHGLSMVSRAIDHFVAGVDSIRRALMLFSRRKPDVIITTAPGIPSIFVGRVLGKLWKRPVIVEMRDAWPDLVTHVPGLVQEGGPRAVVKRLIHELITGGQRGSSGIVTTTSRFADVLAQRGLHQPTVIRNGASLALHRAIPPREIPQGDEPRELRAVYVGNLGRSQGLDVVLMAAAKLRDEGLPVRVRLVGRGAEAARLAKLNTLLGSPAELVGPVPASQVGIHYAWADTTIVSLKDWEPFEWTVPSKLYELLAVGRHITCLLGGEGAQIVRETNAGDVVTPGDVDGLVTLWRGLFEEPERLARSEEGRRWVSEHVEFERLGAKYLELIEQVAAETKVS